MNAGVVSGPAIIADGEGDGGFAQETIEVDPPGPGLRATAAMPCT
ncbi:hypothetical protein [Rhodanobacter sp. T12-5]|nr:hypothetical protein [Rhodanobacter sp. T12-5]